MAFKVYIQMCILLAGVSISIADDDDYEHVCRCEFNVNEIAMGKIRELETRFAGVEGKIATDISQLVQQLMSTADSQQSELERIMSQVQSSSEEARSDMMKYFTDLSGSTSLALKSAAEGFKKLKENMTAVMEAQTRKIEALEQKIGELEDREHVEPNEKHDKAVVAFFASNHIGRTQLFSRIVTNVGNAYNSESGEFTCPVYGIYLFTFSVQSVKHVNTHCNIMKNGNIMTYAQTTDQYADTSSISAILELEPNDTISLGECQNWRSAYSGDGTTFGGVLLHELAPKLSAGEDEIQYDDFEGKFFWEFV